MSVVTLSAYPPYSVKLVADIEFGREHAKELKEEFKGKYNPKLRGGGGWIFPKTKKKGLIKFLQGKDANVIDLDAQAEEFKNEKREKLVDNISANLPKARLLELFLSSKEHLKDLLESIDEKILREKVGDILEDYKKIDLATLYAETKKPKPLEKSSPKSETSPKSKGKSETKSKKAKVEEIEEEEEEEKVPEKRSKSSAKSKKKTESNEED